MPSHHRLLQHIEQKEPPHEAVKEKKHMGQNMTMKKTHISYIVSGDFTKKYHPIESTSEMEIFLAKKQEGWQTLLQTFPADLFLHIIHISQDDMPGPFLQDLRENHRTAMCFICSKDSLSKMYIDPANRIQWGFGKK